MTRNVHFTASHAETARAALSVLTARYGQAPLAEADVVVALGGDGFMLQTLHETQGRGLPVYGMNRGTVGFLMNAYAPAGLYERLALADPDLGAAYQGSAQALLRFDQRARTVHLHELPPTERQRHLSSLPGYSRRIGSERELRPELGEDVS